MQKEPLSLSLTQSASLLHTTLSRQPSFTIKPRQTKQQVGADIEIPAANFVLPPRDDAAEFDDSGENYNFNDDPRYYLRWDYFLVFWHSHLQISEMEEIKQGRNQITNNTQHRLESWRPSCGGFCDAAHLYKYYSHKRREG